MELIRKETEAVESREPGTEENPLESLQKQAHQDDPQQAAVAELPRFVDLVLQTDDEGRKEEKRSAKRFYIFSSVLCGKFSRTRWKWISVLSQRFGEPISCHQVEVFKGRTFRWRGHFSSLLFSSFSACL